MHIVDDSREKWCLLDFLGRAKNNSEGAPAPRAALRHPRGYVPVTDATLEIYQIPKSFPFSRLRRK